MERVGAKTNKQNVILEILTSRMTFYIIYFSGGERGIRTPGTGLPYTRFPSGRIRPLCHLSRLFLQNILKLSYIQVILLLPGIAYYLDLVFWDDGIFLSLDGRQCLLPRTQTIMHRSKIKALLQLFFAFLFYNSTYLK